MMCSPQATQKLRTWVGIDTWDSHHPLDDARFHAFVDQLGRDRVLEVDRDELRDHAQRAFGFAPNPPRLETFDGYVSRMNHILEFIRWQDRPATAA